MLIARVDNCGYFAAESGKLKTVCLLLHGSCSISAVIFVYLCALNGGYCFVLVGLLKLIRI